MSINITTSIYNYLCLVSIRDDFNIHEKIKEIIFELF